MSTTKLSSGCQDSLANPSGIAHGHNGLVSALIEGWCGTPGSVLRDLIGVLVATIEASRVAKLGASDIVILAALATMYDVPAHSSFSSLAP